MRKRKRHSGNINKNKLLHQKLLDQKRLGVCLLDSKMTASVGKAVGSEIP